MSAAPYSTVSNVTPTTFDVKQDEGAKFTAPFRALLWPGNAPPRVGNHVEVDVTVVTNDTLAYSNPSDSTVPIQSGWICQAKNDITTFALGQAVQASTTFALTDPGDYLYVLRNPDGELGAFGTATGVVHDPATGIAFFNFTPDRSGLWHQRWSSVQAQQAETSFFVAFSATWD